MYIYEMSFLKNLLGEEETKQYLAATNERVGEVVKLLKETTISQNLEIEKLKDLCHKLILGKYGQTLCKLLYWLGNLSKGNNIFSIYYNIIDKYLEIGFAVETEYIQLLKNFVLVNSRVSGPTVRFSIEFVQNYLNIELEQVNSLKITVKEYLDNGGTLMNLLSLLAIQNIKEFDLNTNFIYPDKRIIEEDPKVLKIEQPEENN